MPLKKFATIYSIVIGMAVLAVVVALRYGRPGVPPAAKNKTSSISMQLATPNFADGSMIPRALTCDGAGLSLAFHITGVPEGAQSLALIVHDPDAPRPGGFTHWVVWNISPSVKDIAPGKVPDGSVEGENSAGRQGYVAPCPPSGHGVHHYHFMLYALDAPLSLHPTTDKKVLEAALEGHMITTTELVGLYERHVP